MYLYKIYWIDEKDGEKSMTYVEAATAKRAREKFLELGYGYSPKIYRVKRDE